MKQIVQHIAVKAIIINEHGQVLILRKSDDDIRHAGKSGRYNLPGGKIKPGEKVEDALKREVNEETGLTLNDSALLPVFVGEWRPVINNIPNQIIGTFFACQSWTGQVQLDSEHDRFAWIDPNAVDSYDMLPPEDQAIHQYFKMK